MAKSNQTFITGSIMAFAMGGAGIIMSSVPVNMAYMGLGLGAIFAILMSLSSIEAAIRKE